MGLDSYVFRITKAEELEPRVYTAREILDRGLEYFPRDGADEELVRQLLPYCREVRIRSPQIDIAKIRREYGLSGDAYISMMCGSGAVALTDPKGEGGFTEISGEDVREKFLTEVTETCCVYRSEQVCYWRKNYAVRDFFCEHLDRVENTGFYLIGAEVIRKFAQEAGADWGVLPDEPPTAERALFYHEWY